MLFIRFLLRIYNLYFSKDKLLAQRIRNMTGFVPARLSIFKLAFSHKSNQNTRDYAQTNNERLEYLGDAVLGTVVAEYLFKKYPNADEGFLTKMRSKIVKRKSLNHIGQQMELDVLLSEYNRTRLSASMLGNAVEALVGAVYLEKGYRPTKRFIIQRMLKLYVDMHELETVDDNYKSQLLEYCQKNGKSISYKLVKKFKQERRDRFKVAVVVGGKDLATADDFNKKAAEQLASRRALIKLGVLDKAQLPAPQKQSIGKTLTAKHRAKPAEKEAPQRAPKPKRAKPSRDQSSSAHKTQAAPKHESSVNSIKKEDNSPTVKSTTKAIQPPPKKRRNTTLLGRNIWHGVSTAAAVLNTASSSAPKPLAKKETVKTIKRKQVSSHSELTELIHTSSASIAITETPSPSASVEKTPKSQAAPAKSTPVKTIVKATSRARRPVPLRILTSVLADAGAALNIDVEKIVYDSRRVPKDKRTSTSSSNRETPLTLEDSSAAIEAANNAVEHLADWEDTLLEATPSIKTKATTASSRPSRRTKRIGRDV